MPEELAIIEAAGGLSIETASAILDKFSSALESSQWRDPVSILCIAGACGMVARRLETMRAEATKPLRDQLASIQAPYREPIARAQALREQAESMVDKDLALEVLEVRRTRKLDIFEPGLLPRKFLKPDEEAIQEALDRGEAVPGVAIIEDYSYVAKVTPTYQQTFRNLITTILKEA